jgi:hypothetical protein
MRNDLAGLFWDDTPVPKVLKEKVKRTPPEPTWLAPDYLPGLEEARAFQPNYFTIPELMAAHQAGEALLYDVEVYPNYFLVSFASFVSGKVISFELYKDTVVNTAILHWILTSFCIVGFNSISYDIAICTIAANGGSCEQMQWATEEIILRNERGHDVLKALNLKPLTCNHIDLIEVAPLRANLKIYGGRLHVPRMQDLPFKPGTELSDDQVCIVKWYNINDLVCTAFMYRELAEQIHLRERLSAEYRMDLRSKSDAQIAEAVIVEELARYNGSRPKRPAPRPGHFFNYGAPSFIQYQTPLLQNVLRVVSNALFVVDAAGYVNLPQQITELEIDINGTKYQMGIGGLHSQEQKAFYISGNGYKIKDRDVTSYYPKLILNSRMYPPQCGPAFQMVYNRIVDRRVAAKAAKLTVEADSLKITANGTFGKTLSPHSALSCPEMGIHCTVTGQLSLLMLVERLELRGYHVVSANTDGVVILVPDGREAEYEAIIKQWEADTNLQTEETEYAAIFSRDVNNYIAIKPDGKVKSKGAYANPWSDPKLAIFRFHKNPVNLICTEAVEALLTKGTPLVTTVRSCTDITKFVTVRSVRGGAVKDGVYLGKSIRWYYAVGEAGEIIGASNGNKVPRSDGARPLMQLPNSLPADLDFDWYVREADDMLQQLGLASTLTREVV